MHIEISHDNQVKVQNADAESIKAILEAALAHFADRITRIECHLSDVNAAKGGANDKRCMLEGRLTGLQPIAVTHEAASLRAAIEGAAKKLEHALDHRLGKLGAH
jgi:ribosome-associated translation inhibitor RaiA